MGFNSAFKGLIQQLTLGPVHTEHVHTFLTLSDTIVRRRQSGHNTRIVWSCHVVQWRMSEHLKIRNASKSALRFAVHIAGFILPRNCTPHCFPLRLLSFLSVFLSSFRSYSWFPFCFWFVYLTWFLFFASLVLSSLMICLCF